MVKQLCGGWLVACLPAACWLCSWASAEEDAMARYRRVAERWVARYNAQDYAGCRQDWAEVMVKALSADQWQQFCVGLRTQYGAAGRLEAPRLGGSGDARFRVVFERGALDMKLVLDGQDRMTGLWFQPPAADLPVPERHQTDFSLPFAGRWLVFWGGDTAEQNQHHGVLCQRFAFDLLGVGEDGKTVHGEGTRNEDYNAFGREILAPADGVVVEAVDGVRDNAPGSMNPYAAIGNAVTIRHRDQEYTVLAHLKQGSVRVKAGEEVKRGQVLGLCGNSGNSSEPHLHFHLQNTATMHDATGIKLRFGRLVVTRGGAAETVEGNSPVKGEIIANSP
ncbi:MAG: M23 family metallopeptidase [Planctomycetes bacterium]|nr:M23 family metallopeptidase [Planctomycetota bacterium]